MGRNQKLTVKYYGPYKVDKKMCNVAYQLNLPAGSKIHDVLHVSQLKKRVGTQKIIQTDLPGTNEIGEIKREPLAVLDRVLVKKLNKLVNKILIQWTNGEADEATWEYWEEI
ncbi:uncharacterized protein LOC141718824 [Apium graveolens]|uniref:uncharacterized protein LOC141718824 n=1 Tax=Apium graveolens TaxID=4045 RepID=UPI003D7BE67A